MYTIAYDNPTQGLIERLLSIRAIDMPIEEFLHPDIQRDWSSPMLLHDIQRGVDRIARAITNNERIIVFGDYDVDGMTASSIVYLCIKHGIGYNNISVRLPHRIKDGYGIRTHHIDEIIDCGASLIITVDNGITAINEAAYATSRGIDMVITDHHKALDTLPQTYACINPTISPQLAFSEIAGATVARKVMMALLDSMNISHTKKQQYFNLLLPYAAIGTIADCCPLLHENRAIVSTGLDMINRGNISRSLRRFSYTRMTPS